MLGFKSFKIKSIILSGVKAMNITKKGYGNQKRNMGTYANIFQFKKGM